MKLVGSRRLPRKLPRLQCGDSVISKNLRPFLLRRRRIHSDDSSAHRAVLPKKFAKSVAPRVNFVGQQYCHWTEVVLWAAEQQSAAKASRLWLFDGLDDELLKLVSQSPVCCCAGCDDQ